MEKIKQTVNDILNEGKGAEEIKRDVINRYRNKLRTIIKYVRESLKEAGAKETSAPNINTTYQNLEIRINFEPFNSADDGLFWNAMKKKFGTAINRNKTYPISSDNDLGISFELDEDHASIFISRIKTNDTIVADD